MSTIAGVDLTSPEILVTISLILIFSAVFLLIMYKIARKKTEPKEVKGSELAGIVDIKPGEFNLERLDIKMDILHDEKNAKPLTWTSEPRSSIPELAEVKQVIQEKPAIRPNLFESRAIIREDENLKLEDELPEEPFEITSEQRIETQKKVEIKFHVEQPEPVAAKEVKPEIKPPEVKVLEVKQPETASPREAELKIMTLGEKKPEVKQTETPPASKEIEKPADKELEKKASKRKSIF